MTLEEAIEILEKEKAYMIAHGGDRQAEALTSAIKALEQEPCSDVISKQAVINSFKNWLNDNKDPRSFEEVVKEMPSAISGQKEGLNY